MTLSHQEIKILADMISKEIGPIMDKRWLTIKEACSYARMSENVMRECISNGEILASRKRPGKIIVDRLSIDEYYGNDIIEDGNIFSDIAKRAGL